MVVHVATEGANRIFLTTCTTVDLLAKLGHHHHHAAVMFRQNSTRERRLIRLLMLLGEPGCLSGLCIRSTSLYGRVASELTLVLL